MYLSSPLSNLFEDLKVNGDLIAAWVYRILGVVAVWVVVWILVRHLSRWVERLDKRVESFDVNPRDMRTLDRLVDYVIIMTGVVVSLAILGWTSLLYSALTAAGVFSVIMGFAVKDVAANFVSGIFLLIDQPFAPGDYIEIDTYAGTVEDISLRATTLVTLDGPVIHIPNSVLAVKPTTNYSVAAARRIDFTISIANDTDVQGALETVQRVLADEEGLLTEPGQSVLVKAVREYAVDIGIVCYAPNDTWITLASDLKQKAIVALQQVGVELAVPVRKNVNLGLAAAQADGPDES